MLLEVKHRKESHAYRHSYHPWRSLRALELAITGMQPKPACTCNHHLSDEPSKGHGTKCQLERRVEF